ncbi:hypothetical protein [Actinoplanes sp. NPDC051411]|uniref:hypothetical protein n=1 Tax=Actinoplanes sp. NPDC051411 TaxID=3155522 RepID=UPI003435AB66
MPERYGPWQSAHRRSSRWAAGGTWVRWKAQVIALAETRRRPRRRRSGRRDDRAKPPARGRGRQRG